MEFLLNRYRNLTVLLLVVAAQLVLLAYQVKSNQDVRLIRVWAVTAVTPLAKILEVVRRNTIGVAEDYFVLIHVREDNRKLNGELGRLKMENQFLKTELQTADRAQALRAFQSRTPSRTIASRIIGSGTGANSRVVFVDRGSGSGIMRGMAVVTPDGIVGKVLASYPTASQVLLITDPTFAAGVISQKNRVHGTLKGTGQNKCIVDYVQNEEKVDVGEVFYTSGDDRVFPKGMPVGTASVVREGKTFKEIYIVPTGSQNGLEEVLIVIDGVHQAIPEAQSAVSAPDFHILGPPPGENASPTAQAADPKASVLNTDADRLRDKYKKIGEAQNFTYGAGANGSKPPNFNLNPTDAKLPKPAAPAVAKNPDGTPVSTPAVKPKPPGAEVTRAPLEIDADLDTPETPRKIVPPAQTRVKPDEADTGATRRSAVPPTGTPTKRPLVPDGTTPPTTTAKPPVSKPANPVGSVPVNPKTVKKPVPSPAAPVQ